LRGRNINAQFQNLQGAKNSVVGYVLLSGYGIFCEGILGIDRHAIKANFVATFPVYIIRLKEISLRPMWTLRFEVPIRI
jgi:hypothetical protein